MMDRALQLAGALWAAVKAGYEGYQRHRQGQAQQVQKDSEATAAAIDEIEKGN